MLASPELKNPIELPRYTQFRSAFQLGTKKVPTNPLCRKSVRYHERATPPGRLRPRRAVFRFARQINDSTETIFEHPSTLIPTTDLFKKVSHSR